MAMLVLQVFLFQTVQLVGTLCYWTIGVTVGTVYGGISMDAVCDGK